MGDLEGKRAFVTGGASGIGQATAIALGDAGADVTVADVDREGGEHTAELIRSSGGSARFVECDVTDDDSVRAAVSEAVRDSPGLHCAANCAGVAGPRVDLLNYDINLFDRMLAVNLRGLFLCMRAELEQMVPYRFGTIVNVASIGGVVGSAGAAPYVASKHGVIGLTKSAALDYAEAGIRINAVCPALVDTAMTANHTPELRSSLLQGQPLGRAAQPSEIAEAILWLCTPRSSYVVGSALMVDGGYTSH